MKLRVGGISPTWPNETDHRLHQSSWFTLCKNQAKTNEKCQLGLGGMSTVVSTNQLQCRLGINGDSKTIARWCLTELRFYKTPFAFVFFVPLHVESGLLLRQSHDLTAINANGEWCKLYMIGDKERLRMWKTKIWSTLLMSGFILFLV